MAPALLLATTALWTGSASAGLWPGLTASFPDSPVEVNTSTTLRYRVSASSVDRDVSIDHTLPTGLEVSDPPDASTDCGPGDATVTATAGGNSIVASRLFATQYDALINEYVCIVTVKVTATAPGNHPITTTLWEGGGLLDIDPRSTATATLTARAAGSAVGPSPVPTLSEWMLGLLMAGLALSGWRAVRRARG